MSPSIDVVVVVEDCDRVVLVCRRVGGGTGDSRRVGGDVEEEGDCSLLLAVDCVSLPRPLPV
jgi:hypothetical protein